MTFAAEIFFFIRLSTVVVPLSTTFTTQYASVPFEAVHFMATVPVILPVIIPLLSTVAIFSFPDSHENKFVVFAGVTSG